MSAYSPPRTLLPANNPVCLQMRGTPAMLSRGRACPVKHTADPAPCSCWTGGICGSCTSAACVGCTHHPWLGLGGRAGGGVATSQVPYTTTPPDQSLQDQASATPALQQQCLTSSQAGLVLTRSLPAAACPARCLWATCLWTHGSASWRTCSTSTAASPILTSSGCPRSDPARSRQPNNYLRPCPCDIGTALACHLTHSRDVDTVLLHEQEPIMPLILHTIALRGGTTTP